MKRIIAALIAGLVLGSTGVAGAVTANSYWSQPTSLYKCEGFAKYAVCRSGGFSVGVTDEFVFVQRGKPGASGPLFACDRWRSWSSCVGDN